jgi:hypothetical protein
MGLREYLADCGTSYSLPAIAGRYQGKSLVICGDAIGVWQDLEAFGCRHDIGRGRVDKEGFDFLTVNKLVETFPGHVEHCYSNEPSVLLRFIAARRQEYTREFEAPSHTHSISGGAAWTWPFGGHGTSGLGAVLVGLGLGYDRIVLCGIPLDDGPHNGEPHWRRCAFKSSEAAGSVSTGRNSHWWRAKQLAFDDKVRSMSGRTREWLGAPEGFSFTAPPSYEMPIAPAVGIRRLG